MASRDTLGRMRTPCSRLPQAVTQPTINPTTFLRPPAAVGTNVSWECASLHRGKPRWSRQTPHHGLSGRLYQMSQTQNGAWSLSHQPSEPRKSCSTSRVICDCPLKARARNASGCADDRQMQELIRSTSTRFPTNLDSPPHARSLRALSGPPASRPSIAVEGQSAYHDFNFVAIVSVTVYAFRSYDSTQRRSRLRVEIVRRTQCMRGLTEQACP